MINSGSRSELAGITGISDSEILELTKLTDLSRIRWVGVAFARMLYDLGIDTVEKASKADPVDLHLQINRINKEKNTYKGQIGLNDIRIFVNAAKEVPLEIECWARRVSGLDSRIDKNMERMGITGFNS